MLYQHEMMSSSSPFLLRRGDLVELVGRPLTRSVARAWSARQETIEAAVILEIASIKLLNTAQQHLAELCRQRFRPQNLHSFRRSKCSQRLFG